MKVLQLGPYPPPHGGVQTNLLAIRHYLRARAIPCTVINLTRHRRPNADGVHYPKNALEVLRLLYGLDFDIAHLHVGGNFSLRLLALGVVCSLIPGKKVILTLHSGGYPSSIAGLKLSRSRLAGLALRRFDRIIAVNSEIKAFFENAGFPSSRIRVIRPDPLVELTEETTLTPELINFFRAHDPVLLSVGGMEPEYNIPIQIQSLDDVRRAYPRAGLVVIGGGSLEKQLRRLVQALPYARDVLLCGDVPHSVTLHVIKNARLLLRTTPYDGDSIAIREALHLETPVIATDNGMRPAGVRLISEVTVQSLRGAIEECLHDSKPATMPQAKRDDNLQEVLNVYAELLTKQASDTCVSVHLPARGSLPVPFTKEF